MYFVREMLIILTASSKIEWQELPDLKGNALQLFNALIMENISNVDGDPESLSLRNKMCGLTYWYCKFTFLFGVLILLLKVSWCHEVRSIECMCSSVVCYWTKVGQGMV